MKINKVAMAGIAALSALSMPSHAVIESIAGEANLVPFVVWDSDPGDTGVPFGPIGINTVVKLTVPSAVGGDVLANNYTAPWTTPTNKASPVNPGSQLPFAFKGTKQLHWYFLNKFSQHVANGTLTVTPDDVVVFDWGAKARAQGIQSKVDGVPGYLVFTTETARTGEKAADFSFFAEAWMIAGVRLDLASPAPTGGVIGLVDAKIPVLPMSDGADKLGQSPTIKNEVITRGLKAPWVSPLISGIRTNWADGDPTDVKVVDVTLGNRSIPIGASVNTFQFPTLVVAWNDRNAKGIWSGVPVDIYNDDEESCSESVDLEKQLNLIWVQTDVTDALGFPIPRFVKNHGVSQVFCVPPADGTNADITNLDRILAGGFMKFQLPEPLDNGSKSFESSAVFFSLPLQYHVTLETDPVTGDRVPTDISLVPFETALGHDRGMFKQ